MVERRMVERQKNKNRKTKEEGKEGKKWWTDESMKMERRMGGQKE